MLKRLTQCRQLKALKSSSVRNAGILYLYCHSVEAHRTRVMSWGSWQKLGDHRQRSPSASTLACWQILLLGTGKRELKKKNSNVVILRFYDLTTSFLAFGELWRYRYPAEAVSHFKSWGRANSWRLTGKVWHCQV